MTVPATEVVPIRRDAPRAASDQSGTTAVAHPVRRGAAAFAIYLAASIIQWGLPVVGHLGTRYVAAGRGDPDFYRWALAWTPWALGHATNPTVTGVVFAPHGVSLAWSAFVPGPALVIWPVTRLFGTLASYNVLMLLAPALAAWSAYLLCHRITRSFWPSLMGGVLFGASASIAGQMQAHLNLVLVFPIPLAVYLVVRKTEGSIGTKAFVAWMVIVALGLISISTELFATAVVFGAIAFGLASIASGTDRRKVLTSAASTVLALAIVGGLVLLPYLLPVLRDAPSASIRPIDRASIDLLGVVVPREGALVGGSAFTSITDRFTAHPSEDGGYLGIALVAMLVGFGISERRRRGTWGLLVFVAVAFVLALGPVLHVMGRSSIGLPERLIQDVPLLKDATPDRFPLYASLAVGVIAAIWLSRAGGRAAWVRWSVVAIGAVMLVQSTPSPPWYPNDRTPAFFTDGTYAAWLQKDENVFLITGSNGEEMAWQAATDFWFRMPEGYIGRVPEDVQRGRLGRGLEVEGWNSFVPNASGFSRWLDSQGVTAIVMGDEARATFEPLVANAGLHVVFDGDGVSVWRSATQAPSIGVGP